MPAGKALSASELATTLAEQTGMTKRDASFVLDELTAIAHHEIAHGNSFQLPKVVKLTPRFQPAKPKRKGRNPMTGEEVDVAAKPASISVRARVLKQAKTAAPGVQSAAGKKVKA